MPTRKGWFRIPGVQEGDRSLKEQMTGLAPLVEAVKGKTVLDLGCAEALISVEMQRAGAALVHGVEVNGALRDVAVSLGATVFSGDLNKGLPEECLPHYDVVLLLAIVHKLNYPEESLGSFAARGDLVVIRLPLGSRGVFRAKHSKRKCDVPRVMCAGGFALVRMVAGPRNEIVQYWSR